MFTAPSASPWQLLFPRERRLPPTSLMTPKHKEYHYQSLLIKPDCFTKIRGRRGVFSVFSAALHLLPDADGLINSSRKAGYDL